MQWLIDLIDRLFCFVPRLWMVEPDEGGLKITLGSRIKVCTPGWFVYWPLIQVVRKVVVVSQLVDLKNQSVRTKDGHSIILSGGVQYVVDDVEKTLLKVYNYDKGIQIRALDTIAEYTKNRTLDECNDFEALKKEIRRGLAADVRKWGIRVEEVLITDLVEGQNIRLMNDIPNTTVLPV